MWILSEFDRTKRRVTTFLFFLFGYITPLQRSVGRSMRKLSSYLDWTSRTVSGRAQLAVEKLRRAGKKAAREYHECSRGKWRKREFELLGKLALSRTNIL